MPIKTTLTPAEHAALSNQIEEVEVLRWNQPGTLTAVTLGTRIVTKPGFLKQHNSRIAVTGTATYTVFEFRRFRAGATVVLATVTLLNTETDPYVAPRVPYADEAAASTEPGDVLEIVLTTVPTAGSNLDITVDHATRY
jgi:hypothetical protein